MTITDAPTTVPSTEQLAYAALVRAVFEAGLHPSVVASRWAAFSDAFGGFDPAVAAAFTEEQVAALARDERLVRNASKMAASVANAQRLVALAAEHGSLQAWLASAEDPAAALAERFVRVGPSVAARVLALLSPPADA